MHAFDDDVSYTRIIDPAATRSTTCRCRARGDQPQLVWRPRLGDVRPTSWRGG